MVPFLHALPYPTFAALGRQAFIDARGEAKGSGVAGELYTRFFRSGRWDPAASGLTAASGALWATVCRTDSPLVRETVVRDDPTEGPSAAKALFRLGDGAGVETVLVPMATGEGGRGTLCVSSQAGCAMGCAFCETGRGGLVRNLSAAEIVAQVFEARFGLGWDFTSLVFMGMGEPLDNLEGVLGALEVLTDPRGLAFAQERITVCTVGLADGLVALAARGWKRMGLSLSLNAGNDRLRETIMPVTRSNPLARVHGALEGTPRRPNFVLALNYCLLPGINDRPDDARDVAAFARGLGRVLVNLIPYNPGTAPLTRAPTEGEVDTFLAHLKAQGLEARVRGPKGRSIMAACGQLGANSP
jgi:23S rRNA (adenine2503-C2)-methyltransferase